MRITYPTRRFPCCAARDSVPQPMRFLADWFIRHRSAVFAGVVALTLLAAWGATRVRFNDNPRAILQARSPMHRALDDFYRDFGSDDNDCVLVVESRELLTARGLEALHRLVASVRAQPEVHSVRSLADIVIFGDGPIPRPLLPPGTLTETHVEWVRRQVVWHPLAQGQLLSADHTTTLVIARLDGEALTVRQIMERLASLRAAAESAVAGGPLRVRLTGYPPVRLSIYGLLIRQEIFFIVSGVTVAIAAAALIFRRPAAVVIVAAAAAVGVLWSVGAAGLLGEKINIINSVLPTMVIMIALTDACHMVHGLRHARGMGLPPDDAARWTIRYLFIPCLLCALTTAIGFASMYAARVELVRNFGLICALGTMLALLAVCCVVPLLGATRLGLSVVPIRRGPGLAGGGWVRRTARIVTRYPKTVALAGTAATAALLAVAAARLHSDYRLRESIPSNTEAAAALAHCDAVFGGALFVHAIVRWPEGLEATSPATLEVLRQVHDLFESEPRTRAPMSLRSLLSGLAGPSADVRTAVHLLPLVPEEIRRRFVRPDLRSATVMARVQDLGTHVYLPVFDRIERGLARIVDGNPGFSLRLTGSPFVTAHHFGGMIEDLRASLLQSAIAIFLVIAIGLRSLRLGLISILPNLFPLGAAGALLVFVGRPLQVTSVIVFAVSLGLAVDHAIHMMGRLQHELRRDGRRPQAVRRTYVAIAPAIVIATAVLLSGFSLVLFSEMPILRDFGSLAVVAMLAAAIGDLLILPALLTLFAPRERTPRPFDRAAIY